MFISTEQAEIRGMGTYKILEMLSGMSNKRVPTWDVMLVNVLTLIRNNLGKNTRDDEVAKWTYDDIDNIVSAYANHNANQSKPADHPHFVVYFPNYEALPMLHRRKPNATTVRLYKIMEEIIKKHHPRTIKGPQKDQSVSGVECYVTHAGDKYTYPHQVLSTFIMKTLQQQRLSISRLFGVVDCRVGMISHCPIDLHMSRYLKKFSLIESFTGEVKSLDSFGTKIFKKDFLPFNSVTHLLFGDSVQIEPMAKNKTKALLLERAQQHRWISRSEASIIDDVVVSGLIPKPLLTTVKF